jgi:hypothetical protein
MQFNGVEAGHLLVSFETFAFCPDTASSTLKEDVKARLYFEKQVLYSGEQRNRGKVPMVDLKVTTFFFVIKISNNLLLKAKFLSLFLCSPLFNMYHVPRQAILFLLTNIITRVTFP